MSGGDGGGSDFLALGSVPARDRTGWLTSALRTAIADGRLAAGTVLPATRTLAADLAVARGVVVEAYRRLIDEGALTARAGSGTVVATVGAPLAAPPPPRPVGPPAPFRLPLPPVEGALDLAPGVPDLAAFPRAAWLRAERRVLATMSTGDLGYGDPRGNPRLRAELAQRLARTRGVRTDPDGVLVVAGVAQSLALLAQSLVARGRTAVGLEDPGSRGARDDLAHWGLDPVPVPVDAGGLDVDALAATSVPTVLVTPAHQYPTGVVLAPERRRRLVRWAVGERLVIEDDYDAEHRYDRAPVPALQAAAPDHVVHTGSVSKTLAPGMRLGWMVPPAALYDELVTARHASDLGSPAIAQLVLADLMAGGDYDRHVRLVRARQRQRRDAVLAALREHLPAARVDGVAAGLHLVIGLPPLRPSVGDVEVAAALRDDGIVVHPLSWHRHADGPPGLLLGYAAHPPDRLREAVARIAGIVGRFTR